MTAKPSVITIDNAQREAALNERPLARHLFSVAKYLGIGALVHAWFLGPQFESSSLWSWGYLLAWPIPLGFWFAIQALVFGLYVVLAIVGCAALWLTVCFGVDAYDAARYRRDRTHWQASKRRAGFVD